MGLVALLAQLGARRVCTVTDDAHRFAVVVHGGVEGSTIRAACVCGERAHVLAMADFAAASASLDLLPVRDTAEGTTLVVDVVGDALPLEGNQDGLGVAQSPGGSYCEVRIVADEGGEDGLLG